jgi:hypothetical protein
MDGDAYRDMSHIEIQRLILSQVTQFADYAVMEAKLSNGKVADIYYKVGETTIIIEVKTILKQSLIESAWKKYSQHCHYLAIACPPQQCQADRPQLFGCWTDPNIERVGIWWVQWDGISEVRPACRLDVKTPGKAIAWSPASSPFAVIASPGCTARTP